MNPANYCIPRRQTKQQLSNFISENFKNINNFALGAEAWP